MNKQFELRLSGSGGQGLITAGIILAEAAILDQKNAIQTQSYGPEARGGASKAEVIISSDVIDFPKVTIPNMSFSLTQLATDKYAKDIDPNGVIIVDETINLPENTNVAKIYKLPILHTARHAVGKEIVANIVALGVIVGISKVVTKESLVKAVMNRIPKGTEELNTLALEKGFELVEGL